MSKDVTSQIKFAIMKHFIFGKQNFLASIPVTSFPFEDLQNKKVLKDKKKNLFER